ncbi:chorismate mutase [Falsiroseomonas sp. HW251]|uniref:chorismate mutase n=1 Tax=Falsiroseomonas sp. HW251 TaxID=3390998 RepID=UPI003D323D5E
MSNASPAPTNEADLAALRAEIDTLDDAMHDLLMRRVDVVARLAASGAKGNAPAIRPGREALIIRRLLSRHAGPLPRASLLRLWREMLAATASLQAPVAVAAWADDGQLDVLRAHLGHAAVVTRCADDASALAVAGTDAEMLVALPPGGRWWRVHLPSRLHVAARLPFLGAGPTIFLLSPNAPDASGDDRSLVRLPARAMPQLAASGLPATELSRTDDLVLAELPGVVSAGDARLAALGGTVLGFYATPVPDQG